MTNLISARIGYNLELLCGEEGLTPPSRRGYK